MDIEKTGLFKMCFTRLVLVNYTCYTLQKYVLSQDFLNRNCTKLALLILGQQYL